MSKQYSHTNFRGNGCRLSVKPFAAWHGEEGAVRLSFEPQSGKETFNSADSLEFFCTPNDVAHIIAVFRGCEESVNDGNGLRMLNSILKMEHRIDPVPGYLFEIWTKEEDGAKSCCILLDRYEALELSLALEGVMSKLVFGM